MASSIRVFRSLARASRPCPNTCTIASKPPVGPWATTHRYRHLSNSVVRRNENSNKSTPKALGKDEAAEQPQSESERAEKATKRAQEEADAIALATGPKPLDPNDPQQWMDELRASLGEVDLGEEDMKDLQSLFAAVETEDVAEGKKADGKAEKKKEAKLKLSLQKMLDEEEDDYGYVVPRKGEEAIDDPMFPEWEADDMSSIAHAELDRHREARHYARIMVYEMPKLSRLAVPFEPPEESDVLRFRYTSYMGVQHPAEVKVVVEVSPDDLGFNTQWQKDKFIKLCGPRYNPSKGIVKMSCEMFKHQAQNKRYLVELVQNLIKEAKNGRDKFTNIPFDHRRHKTEPKRPWFYFPKGWRMTEEKLEAKRLRDWKKATVAQREQSMILYAANEEEAKRITNTKKEYLEFLAKQNQQMADRHMVDIFSKPAENNAPVQRIAPAEKKERTIQMVPAAMLQPSSTRAVFERDDD